MQKTNSDDKPDDSRPVVSNPQPTPADSAPIPQPATDGFPVGDDDLTSRVPGEKAESKSDDA